MIADNAQTQNPERSDNLLCWFKTLFLFMFDLWLYFLNIVIQRVY